MDGSMVTMMKMNGEGVDERRGRVEVVMMNVFACDGAEVSKRPTAVLQMVACLVEGEQSTFCIPEMAEKEVRKAELYSCRTNTRKKRRMSIQC